MKMPAVATSGVERTLTHVYADTVGVWPACSSSPEETKFADHATLDGASIQTVDLGGDTESSVTVCTSVLLRVSITQEKFSTILHCIDQGFSGRNIQFSFAGKAC